MRGKPNTPEVRREALESSRAWVEHEGPPIVAALDSAGWWVGTPVLDLDPGHRLAAVAVSSSRGRQGEGAQPGEKKGGDVM